MRYHPDPYVLGLVADAIFLYSIAVILLRGNAADTIAILVLILALALLLLF